MLKPDKKFVFILAAVICIFYAFYFKPITWQAQGDCDAYITLAKQFIGTDESHMDLSNESPFYSMVLAIFMKVLNEKTSIQFMIYLQYLLIFLTSILLYKIFEKIVTNKVYLFLLILVFLFNLSTINYGFHILTETLTLFLFVYITYLLVKYKDVKNKNWLLMGLGFLSAIAVLTRFNLLILPLFIWFCIFLDHYFQFGFKKFHLLLKRTLIYFIPIFIILNLWCYKNYSEKGFYFLWPPAHMAADYLVLPMVNGNTKVTQEHQEVLKIILKAKNNALSVKNEIRDSSFFKYIPLVDFYQRIISGPIIFWKAQAELEKYYGLKNTSKYMVLAKLKPFLEEVSSQNKMNIFFMRVFSFFYSFKWTYTPLPVNTKINLNILPTAIVLLYKLAFIAAMIIFVFFSFYFLLKICVNKTVSQHYSSLVLLILISYFPLMNFLAITYSDANRFKFPSEPLIFGMIFFFIFKFFNKQNKKCIADQT